MTVLNLGCRFFSDFDVGACIFYENMSIETFTCYLKAHRISNNMVLKLLAWMQEKMARMIRNVIHLFVG